jgi:hypothetical protein
MPTRLWHFLCSSPSHHPASPTFVICPHARTNVALTICSSASRPSRLHDTHVLITSTFPALGNSAHSRLPHATTTSFSPAATTRPTTPPRGHAARIFDITDGTTLPATLADTTHSRGQGRYVNAFGGVHPVSSPRRSSSASSRPPSRAPGGLSFDAVLSVPSFARPEHGTPQHPPVLDTFTLLSVLSFAAPTRTRSSASLLLVRGRH